MKQLLQATGAMVRNYSALLIVLFVLLASTATYAQTAQVETLTNVSIITMKKDYNFSDALIKSKIKNSPSNFSTDLSSLKQLKDAGIDEDVIESMVNKSGETSGAVTSASKAALGTLSDDKQTYTTTEGKVLTVGQKIKLGSAGNIVNNLFVHCVRSYVFPSSTNEQLSGNYANKEITIKKFYSQGGVTYLFFKPEIKFYLGMIRVTIEAAINNHELVIN